MQKNISYYNSPLGWIEIAEDNNFITSVICCDTPNKEINSNSEIISECIRQLDNYFKGRLTKFDLPLNQNGTAFQRKVWNVLEGIPFGTTVSYAEVAKKINEPKASRAVGAAAGQNKLWIIVPCHRVIGSNGALTGYAGGIERKKWLLQHELNFKQKEHNNLF